jgi:Ca-activated chloride channel homolog
LVSDKFNGREFRKYSRLATFLYSLRYFFLALFQLNAQNQYLNILVVEKIMSKSRFVRLVTLLLVVSCLNLAPFAQSRPQKPTETPKGSDKKNERPDLNKTEAERKAEEEKKRQEEEAKNAIQDPDVLTIATNIVNVDAVVFNKKSGQIVTGLKKENFTVFENGIKQEISNFSTPEAPITVSLVMEYSKWSEIFGRAGSGGFESGTTEVIRPVAYFLTQFIKPPNDYASVIAFDIRPTPITDFTNDPRRIQETINLLLRNSPAFRENNLFDAIKFALVGGKGDTVVLENSKDKFANYSGMVAVKAKRRAIIVVASGIDTFSRTRYDEIRRIIQEAGVPIYLISTGNIFFKRFEDQLPALDSISGFPGRLTFQQAQNTMNTFAKESGGMHQPITFESEVPDALRNINALLRNQYSIAFDATEKPKDGKKNKLEVRVDVNGDGKTDEKEFIVQHRPFYNNPKK